MWHTPLLALHIASGTIGLFSGAAALSLRKGGRGHRLAGDVFVISMITLGASAAVLALAKHDMGNVVGGVFTIYLVGTAWLTVQRDASKWRRASWAAAALPISVAILNVMGGVHAAGAPHLKGSPPVAAYFISAVIASLATVGDIRFLLRESITRTQTLVRHLWRMCFGLFVASGSIFIARPHLFPRFMSTTHLLLLLGFLPLLVMLFWLVRVRSVNAYGTKRAMARAAA